METVLRLPRLLAGHLSASPLLVALAAIPMFVILVLVADQYVNQAKRTGQPLGYAVMDDAVVSHTRYGSVPVHSQAPAAAALLIAYLHTPEGQKWMWDKNGFDFHLYPESHEKKVLDGARARGAKIAINSPQWLASFKGYRKNRKSRQSRSES